MANRSFIGTWRLKSCELKGSDGSVTFPFGKLASGYIMYNADGFMSVVIMAADRKKFATPDILGGSTEEKNAAVESYVSYCGRYEIAEKRVIHNIEISLFPNWVGTSQERFFEFKEDKLFLTTEPFLIKGKHQTAYLIWKRV